MDGQTWRTKALAALLAIASGLGCSSSPAKGDAAAGATGTAGTTETGGATGTGGSIGGDCTPLAAYTEASHLIVDVNWPAGTASMKGSGQIHIWGKAAFTPSGNTLSASLQACGIVLPASTLTALGGGGMILIEVPTTAWDAPSMPHFQVDGTQTGPNIGDTLSYSWAALVGFTLDNAATAAWPTSNTGITMTSDAEGDNHPGLTSIPRSGTGYTLPPTSILQTSRADQLYIVTRQVTSVTLTRTACDETSGNATFTHLDNHVIGCHVMGGSDCMPAEANFIDQNRAIYDITGATAKTKSIDASATCADVRAALPM